MSDSLKSKTIKGTIWSSLECFSVQGLSQEDLVYLWPALVLGVGYCWLSIARTNIVGQYSEF